MMLGLRLHLKKQKSVNKGLAMKMLFGARNAAHTARYITSLAVPEVIQARYCDFFVTGTVFDNWGLLIRGTLKELTDSPRMDSKML